MTLTFEAVRSWAESAATTWARDADGSDRLAFDDLEPAWALRVEAFNLLLPVGAAAVGVSSDLGTPGLLGEAKRRGLDRAARAWALRVQSLASGTRMPVAPPPTGLSALLLAEVPTPSMLGPMLRVAQALPAGSWLGVAADPRAFRAFRRVGPRVPLVLPLGEERARLRRAEAAASAAWERIIARPPTLAIDGREVTRAALRALEPLARNSLPWLAVERAALERLVANLRPRWIVVASDQHRLGRVAVEVAHRRGARVIVLQHGLPQYDLGYVPVVADAVATWSEADDAWFTARGTPPERLHRYGNPRLDDLPQADRAADAAATSSRLRLRGDPRLLIALSPSDRARNAELLDLGLGLLAADADAALVLKLHPGDGRWEEVRARVRAAPEVAPRVRIVRRDPLPPLLGWATAVLLHRSTVAVEALAAGTPVLVGAVGAESPEDALPEALELPEVSTVAALAEALRGVADERGRRSFIASRRTALEASTGPLDGGAARRIAAHVLAE